MKYIEKKGPPREYVIWRRMMKGDVNENYNELKGDPRVALVERLLAEQGCLCAYTMKKVDSDSCHVEHIKPESLCRADKKGSDLDYENLVACYPKEGMKAAYRFGAQKKDSWWVDNGKQFISPLTRQCETQISFTIEGEAKALNEDAKVTISVLELNHSTLVEDRARAISEFIYGDLGDAPLSMHKTEQFIETILQRDKQGNYREFCIAIKRGLEFHKRYLESIIRKRKFAQQTKHKK